MTVRRIVKSKGEGKIITAKPGDSVQAVAEVLARHRIGAVIVSSDGGSVEGILSERDIVRALGTSGVECMTRSARELMTEKVQGCAFDDTAVSVMERMTEGRFRHMPVLEDGKLVAVISIGDVVKARISEMQNENQALTGMIANTW